MKKNMILLACLYLWNRPVPSLNDTEQKHVGHVWICDLWRDWPQTHQSAFTTWASLPAVPPSFCLACRRPRFPPATAHSSRVMRRLILGQTPVWLTGPCWSVRIRDHTHTHTHRGFFSALLTHRRQEGWERKNKKRWQERRLHISKEVSFGFLLLLL